MTPTANCSGTRTEKVLRLAAGPIDFPRRRWDRLRLMRPGHGVCVTAALLLIALAAPGVAWPAEPSRRICRDTRSTSRRTDPLTHLTAEFGAGADGNMFRFLGAGLTAGGVCSASAGNPSGESTAPARPRPPCCASATWRTGSTPGGLTSTDAPVVHAFGGAGDDELIGTPTTTAGNTAGDVLDGGPGDDTLVSAGGDADAVTGGPGVDTWSFVGAQADVTATLAAHPDVENLVGGDRTDTLAGVARSTRSRAGAVTTPSTCRVTARRSTGSTAALGQTRFAGMPPTPS